MAPPRRRRGGDTANPTSTTGPTTADELLALATDTTTKPTFLKTLIHSLPSNSPILLHLPSTLHVAISTDLEPQTLTPENLAALRVHTSVLHLLLTHPVAPTPWPHLSSSVQLLHDSLRRFDSAPPLLTAVAAICEDAWRSSRPDRELLISQSLPFLLSSSLTNSKKSDVKRVVQMRDAFTLFDYEHEESIEDLKLLLLRCFVSPVYLKSEEGKRFLAFVLSLNEKLCKEALELVRSQIPMGRKSVLEAYKEVLFRAWRNEKEDGEEEEQEGGVWVRKEIEQGLLQGLVEAAVVAGTKGLAVSVRRVLVGFVEQRAVPGVERMLFRITEPVIFRSLQVK